MIISDGTTDLTFLGTRTDDFMNIDQSSVKTAGGGTRTIRSGKRFRVIEQIRITGSEFESLIDLLMNGANDYYYTPTITPAYVDSTKFPMSVRIDIPQKIGIDGGGTKRYYVELDIEGTDYL